MLSLSEQLESQPAINQVIMPDLWQQEAVAALRSGKDVVVHAPTGAGKTLVFELWSKEGRNRGQAVYTVPTRALANDKLAEWRARGWNVGISTGDLSDRLDAPVVVATLETQKNRLIDGNGPALLVVDEYQMLGDADRGLNYELSIALAPPTTQLLLLSGSVANPQDVAKWLRRLGRDAVLVRFDHRPVPLEEVHANSLSYHVPSEVRTYWGRLVVKALAEDLGPVLVFAPRRQATESVAEELSKQLPTPNPLQLSPEQRELVGEKLARMLKARIAYHHSGLSYGARAGVIEPLAKAGQLRVVVATMGLAAGINFSLRSVVLAGDSYRRDLVEQPLRPDEILQMFGRAGRRGIDETGYVIVSANEIRLRDSYPGHLARNGLVDWGALLGVMSSAADHGRPPFLEAVRVQERLFSTKPLVLGIEFCLHHPKAPCRLTTDAERARRVRKRFREMLNSRGEWQRYGPLIERPLRDILTVRPLPAQGSAEGSQGEAPGPVGAPPLQPALGDPSALEKMGLGNVGIVSDSPEGRVYGRATTVADILNSERLLLTKWVRRLLPWSGRQVEMPVWDAKVAPLLQRRLESQHTPLIRFEREGERLKAWVSLAETKVKVAVDNHGVAIWKPLEREVLPEECAGCPCRTECAELPTGTGVALLWRRLGLVDLAGKPTLRGRMVSFFSQGDGLAIAAALEDESYDLSELLYDLADLDAGFRFCGEDNRWAGRLATACQLKFGLQSIPGYLENGVPTKYGAGAELVVASVHRNPAAKLTWIKEGLGIGDVDRVIIEWRSLLRQIAHAPELAWPRWTALQALARTVLQETESPTLTELPTLTYQQTRRVDHRLTLRRH